MAQLTEVLAPQLLLCGQFPPLQEQCKYMVGNAFVNTLVDTGVVLKECVFQPQQGEHTRAQALPGRSPPALSHRSQSIKVKLVPHSTIFHESRGQKIELGGDGEEAHCFSSETYHLWL